MKKLLFLLMTLFGFKLLWVESSLIVSLNLNDTIFPVQTENAVSDKLLPSTLAWPPKTTTRRTPKTTKTTTTQMSTVITTHEPSNETTQKTTSDFPVSTTPTPPNSTSWAWGYYVVVGIGSVLAVLLIVGIIVLLHRRSARNAYQSMES